MSQWLRQWRLSRRISETSRPQGTIKMKTRTTIVLAAAALALSITSLSIINPRSVRAAVATLIRDQDNPARHPFTAICFANSLNNAASCNTPVIPAGEEVVVETVSFQGSGDPTASVYQFSLGATTSGQFHYFGFGAVFDSGYSQPGNALFTGTQVLRIYADPGTAINCAGGASKSASSSVLCIISGYYVSLP
jgi:hypothetical protein